VGDAGLVVTNDDLLARTCRRLRQHGADQRGDYLEIGGNFRMDAIQAAVLSAKLPHVAAWIRARREHAVYYDAAFRDADGLSPLARAQGWNGAIYTVRISDGRRDALRAHLAAVGIETAVYYERPVHLRPAVSFLGLGEGSFPESERASREVLSLPLYAEITAPQRDHVIESVLGYFRNAR
jgi:dTDP-4-amino-4,6-dideoxygalactose transaminase